jgi:hypothetical protein
MSDNTHKKSEHAKIKHKSWLARHVVVSYIIIFGCFGATAWLVYSNRLYINPPTLTNVDNLLVGSVPMSQTQSNSPSTANWHTYINRTYKFSIKTPAELKDLPAAGQTGSVTVAGKTYHVVQVASGTKPTIRIVKGYTNVGVDPFGDPAAKIPQTTINGTTWNMFINPSGAAGCDRATFQTLAKNGTGMISITSSDSNVCPGDGINSPDAVFLSVILSTFNFIK